MIGKMRSVQAFGLGLAAMLAGPAAGQPSGQAQDAEYGKLIAQHLQDKRFSTELVDHLPASDTVPTPLKFFGRIPGTPGELTYAKDIERYYRELARTSPRVKFWTIGKSEEGRDLVMIAIADEETLKTLDARKADLMALSDPRRTTEAQAQQIIRTGKPVYWVTSGIHSPENGGPETLIETAYRLAVEETPLVQNIRNNMITLITPVLEVDGREKQVDTYYYGKKTGKVRPPLMYWGKYVAHDNNRDGMGQYLSLTKNITKVMLDWRPTVLHDLHEAQSYLYVSTGTGPYNDTLDPIASQEWWMLAQTEVMEMAKRNVPGVFTYGFYDGWVPNYLFWIAMTHNSFGRFYEVQSYGPDIQKELKLQPTATSREWFRPNPPLASVAWGPRNNVNIQQSALLLALDRVATDRKLYLENFWLKSRRAVDAGRDGPVNAWVIPANQTARGNAAEMVDDLRTQGVEVSVADADFTAGGVSVAKGDYVVRGDQPYRTLMAMYASVQNYPAGNPRPYDDTGWTMQYLRNVSLKTVGDPGILKQPMTLLTAPAKGRGGVSGSGSTVVFDHTGDNALVALRFRLKGAKMLAAEEAFEAGGRKYAAGSFILPDADRAKVDALAAELGIEGQAVAAAPQVRSHPLTAPRIGYMHSWVRTQDEGWTRAALDRYGVPYTYFADTLARKGGLRAKYDVIVYPNVGGSAQEQVTGLTGAEAIPYKKSALTPNLGAQDSTDDIRGGLGVEGVAELQKFVEAGGVLIADGSTVEVMSSYGVAPGLNVTQPSELVTKGAVMRGEIADKASPLVYGYRQAELPIYFSGGSVMGLGRPAADPNAAANRLAQNVTPNVTPVKISPWDGPKDAAKPAAAAPALPSQGGARVASTTPLKEPRVIVRFPQKADDILLSGMLAGGQTLTQKPLLVDVARGRGHMVLFSLRPYWRWQTQGSYFLGFNAILNWDHLDAGAKADEKPAD